MQPATLLLQLGGCQRLASSPQTELTPVASLSSSGSVLLPAVRFCLLILVMNFVLRVADNFSSALIELLTLSPAAATPNVANSDQANALGLLEL